MSWPRIDSDNCCDQETKTMKLSDDAKQQAEDFADWLIQQTSGLAVLQPAAIRELARRLEKFATGVTYTQVLEEETPSLFQDLIGPYDTPDVPTPEMVFSEEEVKGWHAEEDTSQSAPLGYLQELDAARAHDADVWPPLWPDDSDTLQFVPPKQTCNDERCPWCLLKRELAAKDDIINDLKARLDTGVRHWCVEETPEFQEIYEELEKLREVVQDAAAKAKSSVVSEDGGS